LYNIFNSLFTFSDVILKVRYPVPNEVHLFKDGSTLVSYLYPVKNENLIKELAKKNMNVFGKIRKYKNYIIYYIIKYIQLTL